jgi:hypothetical protein
VPGVGLHQEAGQRHRWPAGSRLGQDDDASKRSAPSNTFLPLGPAPAVSSGGLGGCEFQSLPTRTGPRGNTLTIAAVCGEARTGSCRNEGIDPIGVQTEIAAKVRCAGSKARLRAKKIGSILGESLGGAWGARVPRPGQDRAVFDDDDFTQHCGCCLIGSWRFREMCCALFQVREMKAGSRYVSRGSAVAISVVASRRAWRNLIIMKL